MIIRFLGLVAYAIQCLNPGVWRLYHIDLFIMKGQESFVPCGLWIFSLNKDMDDPI